LRVLLFADGPTRDYQFVRTLFVNQVKSKQAELSICLQAGTPEAVQDVPPERLLKQFPTRSGEEKNEDSADRYGNLASYNVLIAFDPDWSRLTEEQGRLLEKWAATEGHGLIHVAGPINTLQLARPGLARQTKLIRDLLPVLLDDNRLVERDAGKALPLAFPAPEKFLRLEDEEGNAPLAGWSEFFFDKQRDDWQKTEDPPLRGFYSAYPVKSVKPDAVVIAAVRDPKARIAPAGGKPQDLPYLVAMRYGKGRTVYLGSGETWRLRQFRASFHERFWGGLARYAASVSR
jgi:hypothetical protein